EPSVASDPNNNSLRVANTPSSMTPPAESSQVTSPTQSSISPTSTSSDRSIMIRDERRKRMRSLGIHVASDHDDRTVYELPVVITKTRSRRRVHKLNWKDGIVDPAV
ncbi:hypothetical protein PFISCL1PPCAC_22120, partial [Pristionchus fissidentatus]